MVPFVVVGINNCCYGNFAHNMGIMASIAASIGVVHVTMDDMSSVGY